MWVLIRRHNNANDLNLNWTAEVISSFTLVENSELMLNILATMASQHWDLKIIYDIRDIQVGFISWPGQLARRILHRGSDCEKSVWGNMRHHFHCARCKCMCLCLSMTLVPLLFHFQNKSLFFTHAQCLLYNHTAKNTPDEEDDTFAHTKNAYILQYTMCMKISTEIDYTRICDDTKAGIITCFIKHVLPIEELQVVGIGTEPPKNSVFPLSCIISDYVPQPAEPKFWGKKCVAWSMKTHVWHCIFPVTETHIYRSIHCLRPSVATK